MAARFAARAVIISGLAFLAFGGRDWPGQPLLRLEASLSVGGAAQNAPSPKGAAPAPAGSVKDAPSPSGPKAGAAPSPKGAASAPAGSVKDAPSPTGLPDAPSPGGPKAAAAPSPNGLQVAPSPGGAQGTPSPDGTGETIFDVTKYGAVADGKKDNVQAFMKTWAAACKATGKVKMVIPEGTFLIGQTMFEGPCASNPFVLEVRGNLLAQTDLSQYPSAEWFRFENVNQFIVKGQGTFDGRGEASWRFNDCKTNPKCQILPTNLKFVKCNNSVVQDITSLNSKAFHYFVTNVHNFTAMNLKITAPGNSPNTDGMHLSGCDMVKLSNFTIQTGDDCISVGQGNTNVNITGIRCGPGHGLSVGSLGKYPDEDDVKGIYWSNCVLNGTTNGARIKSWAGSPPSLASSIHFDDIVMESVKNPIIIDQKYGAHAGKPSSVEINDVMFRKIRGTTISKVAVSLLCSELKPCKGIHVEDVDLAYNGPATFKEKLPFSSECAHASVTNVGTQKPPACTAASPAA